ncbi:hypothetical protein [Acinetobacter puyangensis]|uniref:hypothetical protein n=1 Tax=Acinetobacter puyangensis TaxID=1096779 RepID=UPI003A4E439E
MAHYTERQLLLFFQAIQRQRNHYKADLIEAVNQGFGGGKELPKYLNKLRGE